MERKENHGSGDWKRILKIILGATWDGAIEAAKSAGGPVYAGPLGFLRKLQMEFGKISAEERSILAIGVKSASPEDIQNILATMEMKQEEQTEILTKILSGVAQNTAMIDGFAPAYEDILEAVNRLDSLPEKILDEVRTELYSLGRKMDFVQMDVESIPPKVRRDRIRDEEIKELSEQESFENEYLKFVREEYGYLQILGIPSYAQRQPIDAAFISLSLVASGESGEPRPAEGVLSNHPCLIIEGEAGAGKTTLLQWEAVRCCDLKGSGREAYTERCLGREKSEKEKRIIPFFIRLRRLVKKDPDFPEFPEKRDWMKLSTPHFEMEPPKNWLHSVLTEGRALLILDGLDELPPSRRQKFWTDLQNLFNQYKNLKFRVSSRYFPRDGERAIQWQPPINPLTGQTVTTFKVDPLTPDKINLLIDQWHKATIESEPTTEFKEKTRIELEGYPEKLKARLRETQYRRIFELAETPFLCAAICLINRHRRQVLPKERHELYKMLIEALLSLRDKEREITSSYDDLSMEVMVYLHANLAWIMMGGMKKQGERNNDERAYLIEAREEDVLKWLQDDMERKPTLRGKNPRDFLFDYLIPRCGLLRETSKGFLDFRHRALQEYLAGTAAIHLPRFDNLVNQSHDDRWRDTIILAAGGYNVEPEKSIRLIRNLIERGEREKLNICFAVAVACLETASGKLDTETYDLALGKLKLLIPPKNTQEAKALSAAGDQAVSLLIYDKYKEDISICAACAETLSLIGSDDARNQLRKGYLEDKRNPVVLQLMKCPGINPLEIPAILGNVKETYSLRIPEFALEYIRDLTTLAQKNDLESLDLCDCKNIGDFSPLRALGNLKNLNLAGCLQLSLLDSLKNLSYLERLNLADCSNIHDPSPLQSLKNLQYLILAHCLNIQNLEPLSALTNLRFLFLRGCEKISDLSPLSGLKQLEKLDLGYCAGIKDFTPLQSLPNLKSLDLQGVKIPEGLKLPKSLPSVPTPGMDFLEITDGLYMKMVWIKGGEFLMGSMEKEESYLGKESPMHPVELDGFWIGSTPVAQSQYKAIMRKNPSDFKGDNLPVEGVSWNDSKEFCKELSRKTGREYSLPTEAQWEFACRAGSEGSFCFGDSDQRLEHFAWFEKNSENKTHPVGQKRPNAWGLFDMHGNVWEWCEDWYGEYGKEKCVNPTGPKEGKYRMLRGGSWYYHAVFCRSACRLYYHPDIRNDIIGFRVVFVARTQKA